LKRLAPLLDEVGDMWLLVSLQIFFDVLSTSLSIRVYFFSSVFNVLFFVEAFEALEPEDAFYSFLFFGLLLYCSAVWHLDKRRILEE
jgi:hypothetical protein